MFQNYLKTAWRTLWKHKLFAGINIFGLAVAIGGSLLLTLTAFRELSYDRFHENGRDIYRLYLQTYEPDGLRYSAGMPTPMLPALREEVPELAGATRMGGGKVNIMLGGQSIEAGADYVGTDFFNMFSFPVVRGKTAGLLQDPGEAVLSASLAKKLFGDADPVGKNLEVLSQGKGVNLQVSAVVEDPPAASSINYELITRFENHPEYQRSRETWDNQYHAVFVMLSKGQTVKQVEERMSAIVDKYFHETIDQLRAEGIEAPDGEEMVSLHLQPLYDLHFDTTIDRSGSSKAYAIGLLVVVCFILIIAAINFVNLTLGGAMRRAREVGMRKVLGARRGQLILQFWGEAVFIALISLLVGIALAQILLPEYNTLFNKELSLWNPHLIGAIALILIIIALAGGGYPAFVLSRFQASDVLRGSTSVQRPGRLRNALVLIQFTLSILFIASTFIVSQQLNYMRHKPLGFNKEEVISIPISQDMDGREVVNKLRNELAGSPDVLSVSGTFRNLGRGRDGSIVTSVIGFQQEGKTMKTYWMPIEYGFLETLDIQLVEGRSLDPMRGTDSTAAILINETFARQLKPDGSSALGMVLELEPGREVVGIVEDFHFESLANPIQPLSMLIEPGFPIFYALVKVRSNNLATSMEGIAERWESLFPQSTFNGSFLDENVDRLYQGERVLGKLAVGASLLAILLSCMGLFGIALMVIAQRTKEIGIRKVLGASVSQIIRLITSDFMGLVGIALILATPLAWYLMKRWLETYAFAIRIQWWVFLLAGGLAAIIAFATLSWHALRAARSNPVDALRNE